MLKLLIVIVASRFCAIFADETDPPIVCFEKGCVRGKVFKGNFKEYEGFLGIPYAQAPIDELRLKVSFYFIYKKYTTRKKCHVYFCVESEIKESFYFVKDPQPIEEKWKEIYNATEEKILCMQKNYLNPNSTVSGVEDCLYLYVYRPKVS